MGSIKYKEWMKHETSYKVASFKGKKMRSDVSCIKKTRVCLVYQEVSCMSRVSLYILFKNMYIT